MRVFLSGLFHETHCFVSEITGIEGFSQLRGDAILGRRGDRSQIDGFLEVAEKHGWDVLPGVNYVATPSGTIDHQVFEQFWTELEGSLTAALNTRLDAIYLALHGAMVTDCCFDPEGELLTRIRALPGADAIPIFGVFDLHATFTGRMAELSNALVCYRENPHIDAYDSAVRAAELLARMFETKQLPHTFWRQLPLMWPPTGTGTADSPMKDLESLARRIEAEDPAIWAVNIIAGFPFSDVPDAGVSFSIVTTAGESTANKAIDRLRECAWSLRMAGLPKELPIDDALARISTNGPGPVILVEPSDNIGGGAPGDGTAVLRALVRHRMPRSLVVINDPDSVAALDGIANGGRATLRIGGKGSSLDEGPLTLDIELVSRSDGRFTLEDRQSHLAASQGTRIDMGPCAVVRHENVTILLTTRKTPPFDLGQLRSQGIEPTEMLVIGVKAAVAHRRAYDRIAAASYTVATPGPCSSDLSTLPYRNLRRPIVPLDPIADFR